MHMSGRPTFRRLDARVPLGAVVISALAAVALAGCGVSFGSGPDETERFKDLTVVGAFVPGGELTLTLEYMQQYPVTVDVSCDLLRLDLPPAPTRTPGPTATPTPASIPKVRPTPRSKAADILLHTLPEHRDGGAVGEATPVAGTLRHTFGAPAEPGRYAVRCYTPRDENNVISERITIREATPTPPP
jgi:hypothetical protein